MVMIGGVGRDLFRVRRVVLRGVRKTIPGGSVNSVGWVDDGGGEERTSMVVRFCLLAIMTHFSSSNATRHTASAGEESSRTI